MLTEKLPDYPFNVSELSVSQKLQVYEKEKREVARYAASLLEFIIKSTIKN